MENIKKYKKTIIIALILFFLTGIGGVIYYARKKPEITNFTQYDFGNSNTIQETIVGDESSMKKNEEDDTELADNSTSNTNKMYIHIVGEVKMQGIIILDEGSRIVDAIEKAGGTTEKADLSKINLAYILSDGQKVRIPSVDETDENEPYVTDGSGNGILENKDSENVVKKKVNINTATQAELESLTGIGPSLAARIVEYRLKNGKFKRVEDLLNVSGVGESKLEGIMDCISVR